MQRYVLAALAAMMLLPASAAAADTLVASDPAAGQVTALNGTVVWVSGSFPNHTLMQRTPDGTVAPVKGAPVRYYPSIDLGLDADGRLVLTYVRCTGTKRCVPIRDDLQGTRAGITGLRPAGCSVSAPSMWRTRIAWGLACVKDRRTDTARTGLYVRTGSGKPRRLAYPRDAVKYGALQIERVDLRRTRVVALTADIYEYVFSQTVAGSDRRYYFAAGSEGETDASVRSVALGAGGVDWSLSDTEHVGDPLEASIYRQLDGCVQAERMISDPNVYEYKAEALAVDGTTLYLTVPGQGIVTHDFVPERACP